MHTDTREKLVSMRDAAWERALAARDIVDEPGHVPTEADERELRHALDEYEQHAEAVADLDRIERLEVPNYTSAASPATPAEARAEYDRPLPPGATFRSLIERDLPRDQQGLSLGKALRGIITGRWDGAERERRAMSGSSAGAGGALLPSIMLSGVVDLARPLCQVMNAGARVVPMSNRTVSVPKLVTDPSVAWRAENAAITSSDGSVGKVDLIAQSLSGSTVVSREIIEDSDLTALLERAYAQAVAHAFDLAALYGSGSAPEPLGLMENTDVTDNSALAVNGDSFDYNYLMDAVGAVRARNEVARAAIMAPRSGLSLGKLADSTGQYIAPPAYLRDVRLLESGQIPVNETEGTSSDCSSLFVGDFSQLLLGVRTNFEVRAFDQVGAANGQVTLIAWFRGDVAVVRPSAFAVRTGLRP